MLEKIKKNQKIIKLSIGVGVLMSLSTIKGFILSQCGFSVEFWVVETFITILTILFLIFLWGCLRRHLKITVNRNE